MRRRLKNSSKGLIISKIVRLLANALIALRLLAGGAASAQVVATIAGTDWSFPTTPLPATQAPLGSTYCMAMDANGNLYVADQDNSIVFRIAPDGTVTVAAGNGIHGFSGDGGPANMAALNGPVGLAVDAAGNLYSADNGNFRVRKVSNGIITAFAGNGELGFSGDSGPAAAASLSEVNGLAVDNSGKVYIVDTGNSVIRVVSKGIITTFAGANTTTNGIGDGGPALAAYLNTPTRVSFDKSGSAYVTEYYGARVRKITNGIITTIAGNGTVGFSGDGSAATAAELWYADGVAVDAAGNVFIAEIGSSRVREVSDSTIGTVVGSDSKGFAGDGGPPGNASLSSPDDLLFDSAGNLYISDRGNYRVRKVASGIINTVAGNRGFGFSGDQGNAQIAALQLGSGMPAVDSGGNLYIADQYNNRIRKVTRAGVITTVAGTGSPGFSGDGEPATAALLYQPFAVLVSPTGDLYIADSGNYRVRKVSNGAITTVAGNGGTFSSTSSGNGMPAAGVAMDPEGLALDASGNLYIADNFSCLIRKVTDGTVTIIAGQWLQGGVLSRPCGYSGHGGPATSAYIGTPVGLAFDTADNLYFADSFYFVIRRISNGTITTVAGNDTAGFSGDGGAAVSTALNLPRGIAIDFAGNLYIAESGTNRIRKVSNGIITTVAGSGDAGFSGDGGPALSAAFNSPSGVAVDGSGVIYVADSFNDRIRAVLPQPFFFQNPAASGTVGFTAPQGGKAVTANLTLQTFLATNSTVVAPGVDYTATISANDPWLSVTSQSGTAPGLITITADPLNLTKGSYSGVITFSAPSASPSTRPVSVTFNITDLVLPNLSIDHNHLSFTYSTSSAARKQTVTVSNTGSGTLPFSMTIQPAPGQSTNWLTVTPLATTATPDLPATLSVQADPTTVAAGTYQASVLIQSAAGSATVSVVMTVTPTPLIELPSQTGLTFMAIQNGGLAPPQTFSVLSLGSGTLNWTAQTSVLGGLNNWLSVTPNSGVSAPGSSNTPPTVSVSVNPAGLAPGIYYGLVTVTAAGAANTPQGVVAVLQVLSAGMGIAPVVQPNSLVFTGTVGNSSPSSQTV
jgi:sugar lactone lactonase YvrE